MFHLIICIHLKFVSQLTDKLKILIQYLTLNKNSSHTGVVLFIWCPHFHICLIQWVHMPHVDRKFGCWRLWNCWWVHRARSGCGRWLLVKHLLLVTGDGLRKSESCKSIFFLNIEYRVIQKGRTHLKKS